MRSPDTENGRSRRIVGHSESGSKRRSGRLRPHGANPLKLPNSRCELRLLAPAQASSGPRCFRPDDARRPSAKNGERIIIHVSRVAAILISAEARRDGPPGRLRRAPDRDEANLDPLIQRRRDPPQHRQRMAFIVAVFRTADARRGGAAQFTQLRLGETRLGPQAEDLPGDLVVRPRFFQTLQPLGLALIQPAVEDLNSVSSGLGLPGLSVLSPWRCFAGFASNRFLRPRARSISFGGTARSFTIPWDTIAATAPWKK